MDQGGMGLDAIGQVMSQGDIRNFEILIQPLLSGAYGLAYSMLGERAAAEDAVQEAATKAWRGLGRLRKGSSVQAWFFTIVANQCRDARRGSRTTVLSLFDVPEPKLADHADLVARDLDLERAVARLSPLQRGLLFLRYQMDIPPAQIAGILGWRTGTVKSRLHRTLRKLEADMVAPMEENRR
jgi:RNA polymerase sigma factor (sigma-70 family)